MNFFIIPDTKLYPHTFIEYVIIVPSNMKEQSSLGDMLLKSPLFSVWTLCVGLITLTRVVIRKMLAIKNDVSTNSSRNAYIYIIFNTFGLSFGATSVQGAATKSEKTIVLFLSLFCVVAGIFCTGFLLEKLISTTADERINSLEELLLEDDMLIIMPYEMFKLAEDYKMFSSYV